MIATSIEHSNFSNVNKQTLSENSSEENTLNIIIEITKYSSLNIIYFYYWLRFTIYKQFKIVCEKERCM